MHFLQCTADRGIYQDTSILYSYCCINHLFSFHSLSVPTSAFLNPYSFEISTTAPLPNFSSKAFHYSPPSGKNFADANNKFAVLSKLSFPWHRHKNTQSPRTSQCWALMTRSCWLILSSCLWHNIPSREWSSLCTQQLYLRKKWVFSDLSSCIGHTQCNGALMPFDRRL